MKYKLSQEYSIQIIGDFSILMRNDLCNGNNKMIRLNESATFVAKCLEHERTQPELIRLLRNHYGIDSDEADKAIKYILSNLDNFGALVIREV